MKGSTNVMRILHGAALTVGLAACSGSPLAPADNAALDMASAGATVTQFTATDVFTGLVDPGLIEPREKHFVVRGVIVTSRITGSDPRVAGNARITVNEQLLLADGSGPVWGKLEVEADVGGVWEGSWTGQREPVGPGLWVATLKLVGQGRGGAIDGLQFRAQELVYTADPFVGPHYGETTGTILLPH